MRTRRLERATSYVILIVLLIIGLAPFLILLLMSLKSRIQLLDGPFSFEFSLSNIQANYDEVIDKRGFGQYIINSTIVGAASIAAAVALSLPAAYAISRFKFRGSEFLGTTLVSFRFMPAVAVVIPIFLIIRRIGLTDNYLGLILPYIAASLPLMIWILIGFFDEIPRELDDAGRVDGCSRFGILRHVLMPLMGPGIAVAAIFGLIFVWNEFLIGLYVINSNAMQTIPVGAANLLSAQRPIAYNTAATVGILTAIPVFLFSLFAERYIVRGITAGAVVG